MTRGPLHPLLSHLRKLVGVSAPPEQPDAELLGRFVRQQDETAFAALVERHARLVWSVCRNLLPREQDAEDAFQATLLVLARKAGSIRQDRSVASWLHGVARRTALKARTTIARRQKYEQRARTGPAPDPVSEAAMRELQAILDEEVCRLPDKYRAPFILCCLESKSKAEAAHELGWPEGTVASRVATARQRLLQRLARRGIELSAALAAVALTGAAARAAPVAAAVVRAAVAFAARGTLTAGGVTARAIAIAQAVLWTEAASRLRLFLVVVLVLTLTGGAAAWWQRRPEQPRGNDAGRPPVDVAVDGPRRGPEDKPADAGKPGPAAGPDRVVVVQVLDDRTGQPRPRARVSVLGFPDLSIGQRDLANGPGEELGKTRADQEGRYQVTVPFAVTESHRDLGFWVVAVSDGNGLNWAQVSGDTARQNIVLRLPPAHTVRGRLVDAQGHPAAGVAVRLAGLEKRGSPKVQLPGPGELGSDLAPSGTTDAQGGFEVRGVAPGCEAQFLIQDDRFAPQLLLLTTTASDLTDAGTLRLAPRRTLAGTVVSRDTGRPLAGVHVTARSGRQYAEYQRLVDAHTDAGGKFRLAPFPGQAVTLLAYPPAGLPYLVGQEYIDWRDDNPRQVRVTLQPGVLLEGRVTEKGSGKPVAGADIHFLPRTSDNPIIWRQRAGETQIAWDHGYTASGPDGRFVLVGLPGPGHLIVKTKQPDFIHVETTTKLLTDGKDEGSPACPDALLPLDLEEGSGPKTLAVELRRGVTVKGKIVGPDGRPPATAVIVCPTYFPTEDYQVPGRPLPATGGRFELPGLDPDRAVPVLFSDYTGRLGARVEMKGSGEATVRLVPCRSAVVRFVEADGKPALGVKVALDVLVRSHPAAVDQQNMVVHGWTTPSATLAGQRFAEPGKRPGEVRFRGLIPGATYLIQADEGLGMVVKGKFTVAADEDPKVPDVVVRRQAKPLPPR
jgi:RNA polymerase sigma factor (sigma-70 family)